MACNNYETACSLTTKLVDQKCVHTSVVVRTSCLEELFSSPGSGGVDCTDTPPTVIT